MAVRNGVGINELQNFGKYLVKGPAPVPGWTGSWPGRIPKPGRLSLTPMLAASGKIIGDFTVSCLSETEFQLTASYGAQGWHHRWFEQNAMDGRDGRKCLRRALRLPDRRAECARIAGRVTRADVSARRVQVHGRAADDRGHGQLHRAARQLYRRSGL